jgi:hypothetical protein
MVLSINYQYDLVFSEETFSRKPTAGRSPSGLGEIVALNAIQPHFETEATLVCRT